MLDSSREYTPPENRQKIEKIDSIGPTKKERVEEKRDFEVKNYISSAEIFGREIIDGLHWLQSKREQKDETLNFSRKTQVEQFNKQWEKTQTQVQRAANETQPELEEIFFKYLKGIENIDLLAENIYSKYEKDENLAELVEKSLSSINKSMEYREALEDPKLYKKKRKEIISKALAHIIAERCKESKIDEIFTPVIINSLEGYQLEMLEAYKKMKKDIPKFRKEFDKKLKKAMEDGLFPVDPAIVKERLSSLRFRIIDPIQSKLTEKSGSYEAETHTLLLSLTIPEEEKFNNYAHEVFHSLSGQSELRILTKDQSEKVIDTKNKILRVGTRFTKPQDTESGFDNNILSFKWLNEALTEQAALDLMGKKDSKSYQEERKVLQLLIEAGVPRDTLYQAYFDNYIVKTPGERRTPGLKELFTFTNEKFGDRFLVNLDRYISLHANEEGYDEAGASRAIEAWEACKREGVDFAQYLETWASERRGKK